MTLTRGHEGEPVCVTEGRALIAEHKQNKEKAFADVVQPDDPGDIASRSQARMDGRLKGCLNELGRHSKVKRDLESQLKKVKEDIADQEDRARQMFAFNDIKSISNDFGTFYSRTETWCRIRPGVTPSQMAAALSKNGLSDFMMLGSQKLRGYMRELAGEQRTLPVEVLALLDVGEKTRISVRIH